MNIFIIRHAESIENSKDVCQTQKGGSLSPKGRKQAKLLAKFLKKFDIDLILSSDAERAKQTLREILKVRKVPVKYDPLLRERKTGCFVGRSMKEFREARKNSGLPLYQYRPKRGENYFDVRKRAEKFLKKLKKMKENNILIVSHGGLNRMLIGAMLNMPVGKAFELSQENACVNIIKMEKIGRRFVFRPNCLNNTRHLRGELK